MFSKHQLHVLRKSSVLVCGRNVSVSRELSNGAPAYSWKLYHSGSRSHIGRNGMNNIMKPETHDPLVSKVWNSEPKFATAKFSTKIGTPYRATGKGAKFTVTDQTQFGSEYRSSGTRCLVTMSGKGPGLIVFDLDCTLWPHHVDTTVNPPFIQQNSTVVDQDGVTISYYPEVPKVLQYLQSEGYSLAAASRTTKPPAAEQLLTFFDWNKFFKYKEIYPGSKVTHFAKFVEKTGIPHAEMLFFDDEQRNITDMEKEGVKCVFVKNGVNLQLVQDSIEKFKNRAL